jgi:glycosyltransferase involved in cell wall biosynthesis
MKCSASPLVSIVATLYNYSHYVVDMINSVLEQTYPLWELIIVDDASTDNPEKVLSQFDDPRIRYIKLEKNQGYSHARNEGIIHSTGEFIAIVDADDKLTPNSIEVRLAALLSQPKYLWCHAEGKKMDATGAIIQRKKKRKTRMERYGATGHHRTVHGGSLMMRRQFYKELGLFDETPNSPGDNELVRRALAFSIKPLYVPETVTYYRQHPNQMHKSDKIHGDKIREKIIACVEERLREGIHAGNTRLLEN